MERVNPIAWVCPISNLTATANGYTYTRGAQRFPTAPGSYEWLDQDVSSSDAGRTEDAVMHKELITNAVKCNLSWNYRYIAEVQNALKAFDGEYFEVGIYDPRYGDAANNYMMRYVMYKGDRSVKMYNTSRGLSESLSFNIIDTCIKPTMFTATAQGVDELHLGKRVDGEYVESTTFDYNDIISGTFIVSEEGKAPVYVEGGITHNEYIVRVTPTSYSYVVIPHNVSGDIRIYTQ